MKLREIKVKNFRCLADVTIPMDDLTVLVGPNNSGKTSLLDAMKVAFRRLDLQEYDYHISKSSDTPKTCDRLEIIVWFREDSPGEWPESLAQELVDCVQVDPTDGRNSVGLKFSSCYNEAADVMEPRWEFLAADGQSLGGRTSSQTYLSRFLTYAHIFYLSAIRDIATEFSPRSQFWGKILRDLKISDQDMEAVKQELVKLNDQLLGADGRLEQVRESIDGIQDVIRIGKGQRAGIEALPMKPWDLMTKSQVVIKDLGSDVPLPLYRYGQGTQSLAVLFLFQAYIELLFKAASHDEAEAILALEEPEAHLHPQAARALATNVGKLTSQKVIASHSPYFIQEIPMRSIRMFRKNGCISKVLYLKRSFSANLPCSKELQEFCADRPRFRYDMTTGTLEVSGMMTQDEYRKLAALCPANAEEIKQLRAESSSYIADEDLVKLETYAKRMRGEVLFANGWLLCEGQCEYMLLRFFAELLGKPLDREGITIVDFQNNGSPGAFAKLAQAFDIPWVLICDDDDAKEGFLAELRNCSIPEDLIGKYARPLPEGDLECFLLRNGFMRDYEEILASWGRQPGTRPEEEGYEDEVYETLRANKLRHVAALIDRLSGSADASRVPVFFQTAINDLIDMVNESGN